MPRWRRSIRSWPLAGRASKSSITSTPNRSKKTKRSGPAPPRRLSSCLPPKMSSLPPPPSTTSFPLLPRTVSSSAPPRSSSRPSRPRRRSSPSRPSSLSRASDPCSTSGLAVPVRVTPARRVASNAPMSGWASRATPRWSVGVAVSGSAPPIAGLSRSNRSATVGVSPPFSPRIPAKIPGAILVVSAKISRPSPPTMLDRSLASARDIVFATSAATLPTTMLFLTIEMSASRRREIAPACARRRRPCFR